MFLCLICKLDSGPKLAVILLCYSFISQLYKQINNNDDDEDNDDMMMMIIIIIIIMIMMII